MKLPVLSYSLLNTWEICPHQCARRYIIKDLPREPETPEMKWGNEVHSAIEKRLKGKHPLPEPMAHYEPMVKPAVGVEPEMKLGMTEKGEPCDFFADDVWLRGKLDAPIINSQKAVILDWKTGKIREDPTELEIGAMLLKSKFQQLTKIIGIYVWLKELVVGQAHDCSDMLRIWSRAHKQADEIGHAMAMNVFEKTPGPLCGYCSVRDCQHNKNPRYK